LLLNKALLAFEKIIISQRSLVRLSKWGGGASTVLLAPIW
jgi:hypothetical protein